MINADNIKSILALFDIVYLLGTDSEFKQNIARCDKPEELEDFILAKANTMSQSRIMYKVRQNNILNQAYNMFINPTSNDSFILPLTKRTVEAIDTVSFIK